MKKITFLLLLSSVVLPQVEAKTLSKLDSTYQAAIDQPSRPADDKSADTARHPMEMLALAQLKPGDAVVDFFPGRGYFTRLFSGVVGIKGKVLAAVPREVESAKFKPVEAAKAAAKGYENVSVSVEPMLKQRFSNVDVVWTSLNYHDFHNREFIDTDVSAFNKQVFAALKEGGRFVVIDHVAAKGSTAADWAPLHRIDPAFVRKEVESAGFTLLEESKVLANPADDHKLPVFDPAIKGKTDQFAFVFVKRTKK